MFATVVLPALMALAVMLALVSDADARKRRWIEFRMYAPGAAGYAREAPPMASRDVSQDRPKRGELGAVVARLVRDCHHEAAQLKQWPFEVIARIAALDDAQRKDLDDLRATSHSAAERLAAECPQRAEQTGARLNLVEQAVDAADSAFATIEPVLQRFYAALDDEQKARILRDLTFAQRKSEDTASVRDQRRDGRRRSAPKPTNAPPPASPPWADLCRNFTTALRNWPTREIEQGVRLSETQRVVLYELITDSLKAAEALAGRCPPETPITPVRRMAVLRISLQAIRDAAASIRASYGQFYEGLDQAQQARFVEMR